jgi:hypothetical protein
MLQRKYGYHNKGVDGTYYDNASIDTTRCLIVESKEIVLYVVSNHGRYEHLPLWTASDKAAKMGKRTSLVVHAANLISEAMLVAKKVNAKQVCWKEFSLERIKDYTGYVHGLEVNPHHLYFANDILTHNSLFSWRGSDPLLLQRLWHEHDPERQPLQQSYRLPQAVYEYAYEWAGRFTQTERVSFKPREEGGVVVEGAVVREDFAFDHATPDMMEQLVETYGQGDGSDKVPLMFLASCGYMLAPITSAERQESPLQTDGVRTMEGGIRCPRSAERGSPSLIVSWPSCAHSLLSGVSRHVSGHLTI